jgi:multiple sugar transport system substrate-binding protein
MSDPKSTPATQPTRGRHMDRRTFLRTAGFTVGGVAAVSGTGGLLAGCGSSSGGGSSSKKITVAISGTNAVAEKNWRATFAAFTKANPSITVNELFVNANGWVQFFAALETRIAGGTQIDAVYVPTEGMRLFASRGLMAPLDSYVAANKQYVDDLYGDIDPSLMAGFKAHESFQGHTYYLPYAFNTTCIYYSKKAFKDAGVAAPSPSWTWNDFRGICAKLSNSSKRHYGFLLNVDVWGGFEPWLTTNGASIMNPAWTASAINSPATVEAFQFCRGLVQDNLSPAPSITANPPQLLASGDVAMFAGGVLGESTLTQYGLALDDVGIIPYPIKKGPGAAVGIGSIAMVKSSPAKDAVWELIKYVTSPEQQNAGGGGTVANGQLPIRTSASKSKAVLGQIPEGAQYFWQMLTHAQTVPGTSNATAMEGSMDQTWSQMLTGAISPSSAATAMASEIKSNL